MPRPYASGPPRVTYRPPAARCPGLRQLYISVCSSLPATKSSPTSQQGLGGSPWPHQHPRLGGQSVLNDWAMHASRVSPARPPCLPGCRLLLRTLLGPRAVPAPSTSVVRLPSAGLGKQERPWAGAPPLPHKLVSAAAVRQRPSSLHLK